MRLLTELSECLLEGLQSLALRVFYHLVDLSQTTFQKVDIQRYIIMSRVLHAFHCQEHHGCHVGTPCRPTTAPSLVSHLHFAEGTRGKQTVLVTEE
jgi:hypothetical protein